MNISINNNNCLKTSYNYSLLNKKDNKNNKAAGNSQNVKSPIQMLMEQKDKIQDAKNKFIENAIENNMDSTTRKEKTAEYDKQIKAIEKQISELKIEEQNKKLKNDEEKEKNTKDIDEDKKDDMMNDLVYSSNKIKFMKSAQKVKGSMENEKRVLESEIKTDSSRGVFSKLKQERLSELDDNIEKLDDDRDNILKENKKKIRYNNIRLYLNNEEERNNQIYLEQYS